MEKAEAYLRAAQEMGSREFGRRYPHPFLLKRPVFPDDSPVTQVRCDFATAGIELARDIFAGIMLVAPVKKREGNPFPERIVIGRAGNCDVVWRLPFISKVHAHLHLSPQAMRLQDCGAANGTFVNGKQIPSRQDTEVRLGDRIGLGNLSLELCSAERLRNVLLRTTL